MDSSDDESFVIHAKSLQARTDYREEAITRIYNKILKKCFQRIKACNIIHRTYCYYELPETIMGEPTYDKSKCIHYILKRLQSYDYKVRRRKRNEFEIKISWGIKYTPEEIVENAIKSKERQKKIRQTQQQPPQPQLPPPRQLPQFPYYDLGDRETQINNLNRN